MNLLTDDSTIETANDRRIKVGERAKRCTASRAPSATTCTPYDILFDWNTTMLMGYRSGRSHFAPFYRRACKMSVTDACTTGKS